MTPAIGPEEMARYRAGALARERARQQAADERRAAAWLLARRAAQLLREQFGAQRVVVFGSLAHGAWFHERSDIDLAAAGIPAEAFWRAGAALDHLDTAFSFDLVALESAPERLLRDIEEGVEL